MKLTNILKSTKYLNRIYLLVTSAILVILSVFSVIIYYNVEKSVLQNHYDTNRKILYQVKYDIENMDEMVRNLCLSIFFDKDVDFLMSHNKDDLYEVFLNVNKLKASIPYKYPFVHSVYVYNDHRKEFYSTLENLSYDSKILTDVIAQYGTIPKLKPVLRKNTYMESFGRNIKNEDFFSYYLYQSIDMKGQLNGAVIVNVNAEWLINNIKVVNSVNEKKGDRVFIINDKNEFVGIHEDDKALIPVLKTIHGQQLEEAGKFGVTANFVTHKINGKDYIVTFIKLDKPEWTLLKVQPFDEVFQYINKLKTSILVITAIFLTIALVISLSISKGIYMPIGSLLKQIKSKQTDNAPERDEISYLQEVYRNSNEQIEKYRQEKGSSSQILKNYYLQKLLIGSYSDSYGEFEKAREEYAISITLNKPLAICIIKIDGYRDFEQKYDGQSKELYKFAIINIMTETVAERFANEAIDMKNDQIVMVLNAAGKGDEFYRLLGLSLRQAQEYILNYFNISVTVSVSDVIDDISQMKQQYGVASNNSVYRYTFGRMSIITPPMLKQNAENSRLDEYFSLEKKLIEEIKRGNLQTAQAALEDLITEISGLYYSNITFCIFNLLNTIKNAVDEMNKIKLESIYIDFNLVNNRLHSLETLEELKVIVNELLNELLNKENVLRNDKYMILMETIRNIVDTNYTDSGLCLAQIASMLKMSPVYLGRVFKEYMQISFSEYVNDVRLNKAVTLLETSRLNIGQIVARVGLENESYFYKLFKKKFGATPKEYLLGKSIK